MSHGNNKGLSLVELILYIAIIGIILTPTMAFLTRMFTGTKTIQNESESYNELRMVTSEIEADIYEANQLLFSSSTQIGFILDIVKNPAYDLYSDFDVDGIINIKDTDMDNDAQLILPVADQWKAGYNLKDDDDNNDGQKDVQEMIYLSGKDLIKDVNYDGQGWGKNITVLSQKVLMFTLTYFGSKKEDLGRKIDLGNDGVAGTNDSGENDGVISEREIDWVLPPAGHGNRSGKIDTLDERRYIVAIHIKLGLDKNKDSRTDSFFETEISPPFLLLKNR